MPKILLTGFEPFGGEKINPSWKAVSALGGTSISGWDIIAAEIPVVRYVSMDLIKELIREHQPEIIISVGQAGGRMEISLERIGINVDDYGIPDNGGNQPIDEPIDAAGPPAYFSTLPVKAMVQAMRASGVPAIVSNTAGTYLCNHIAYALPHYLAVENIKAIGGFIHIPFLPEQAATQRGRPSMALESLITGLKAGITAAIDHRENDLKLQGGVTH